MKYDLNLVVTGHELMELMRALRLVGKDSLANRVFNNSVEIDEPVVDCPDTVITPDETSAGAPQHMPSLTTSENEKVQPRKAIQPPKFKRR